MGYKYATQLTDFSCRCVCASHAHLEGCRHVQQQVLLVVGCNCKHTGGPGRLGRHDHVVSGPQAYYSPVDQVLIPLLLRDTQWIPFPGKACPKRTYSLPHTHTHTYPGMSMHTHTHTQLPFIIQAGRVLGPCHAQPLPMLDLPNPCAVLF